MYRRDTYIVTYVRSCCRISTVHVHSLVPCYYYLFLFCVAAEKTGKPGDEANMFTHSLQVNVFLACTDESRTNFAVLQMSALAVG